MSRTEEARRFLMRWDPDGEELPDWVADVLDEEPSLAASVSERYRPWDAGDLAQPAPVPLQAPASRRWRQTGPLLGVGLAVAAAALLAVNLPDVTPPPKVTALEDGLEFHETIPSSGGETTEKTVEKIETVVATKIPDVLHNAERPPEDNPGRYRQVDLIPSEEPSEGERALRDRLDAKIASSLEAQLGNTEIAGGIIDPNVQLGLSSGIGAADGGLGTLGAVGTKGTEVYWRDELGFYDNNRKTPPSSVIDGRISGRNNTPADPTKTEEKSLQDVDGFIDTLQPAPAPVPVPVVTEPPTSEQYTDYGVNGFEQTASDGLSTFSIDVDTASYTMTRRKLTEGYLPPQEAVRVEEFVNYLPYDYARPPDDAPFGVDFQGVPSPFGGKTQLVRVGVQGKRVATDQRKSVHLTFLVDTSGSMQSDDKIGLVKYALKALVGELRDGDTVSIVAYAGSAGLVLPPTPISRKDAILSSLQKLEAGGSTAMGAGIDLAYKQADKAYHEGGINRVIVLSDGDANVGQTSPDALVEQIRQYADKGITLTTAGFGEGNYKDTLMEQLADDGDGNYWYIDSQDQARRVFVDQLTSTLVVIAKDVKIQVDWNPKTVAAYRLLGYENRDIADKDFRNDAVDAGEIGSDHQVTALYELVLVEGAQGQLATVRVRNKAPGPESPAVERSYPLTTASMRSSFQEGDRDLRMAIASAGFAELLRGSPHFPEISYRQVASIARGAKRAEYPEDTELISLIERAEVLSGGKR